MDSDPSGSGLYPSAPKEFRENGTGRGLPLKICALAFDERKTALGQPFLQRSSFQERSLHRVEAARATQIGKDPSP